MGPPKQKWTHKALKRGVKRDRRRNCTPIIRDPEFATVPASPTPMKLRDKWRTVVRDTTLLASTVKPVHQVLISRLDNVILEAIDKEPEGSTLEDIIHYLERLHSTPSNIGELVKAKLEYLIEDGILVKLHSMDRYNRVSRAPMPLLLGDEHRTILAKSQADKLEAMGTMVGGTMTVVDVIAAIARAEDEVQRAMEDAEKAAIRARLAQAKAKTAKSFAEGVRNVLASRLHRKPPSETMHKSK